MSWWNTVSRVWNIASMDTLVYLTLVNLAMLLDLISRLSYTVALFLYSYHLTFWECFKTIGRNCTLIFISWELKSFLYFAATIDEKVVETLFEKDTFRYWSNCSILVASIVIFLWYTRPPNLMLCRCCELHCLRNRKSTLFGEKGGCFTANCLNTFVAEFWLSGSEKTNW